MVNTSSKRKITIYMKVTADEYELPLDFSESYQELAKRNNMKPLNLLSQISKANKGLVKHPGKNNGFKFIKLVI